MLCYYEEKPPFLITFINIISGILMSIVFYVIYAPFVFKIILDAMNNTSTMAKDIRLL